MGRSDGAAGELKDVVWRLYMFLETFGGMEIYNLIGG